VVVIGCAGSGKSTLARQLARRTGLPLVERDALGKEGSPGYLSAIAEMAARPRWILDGAPYYADELVYAAADTVVFLDYPKALVLWRVLRRTAGIEVLRRPAGAHRPQGLSAWRDRVQRTPENSTPTSFHQWCEQVLTKGSGRLIRTDWPAITAGRSHASKQGL
jgi:hypothetical protein